MLIMEQNREYTNRKLLFVGILAGALSITMAIVFLMQSASAQTNNNSTAQISNMTFPQINGSVNIQQQTNKFLQDNVKIPFNTASSTAQSQVSGGVVVGGHLGAVQGYLVYIFNVVNYDQRMSKMVIVDAGNGQVLHTSDALPLHMGGLRGFGGCPGGGFGSHQGSFGMNFLGGMHKGMMMTTTTTP
jgi:uncharacterized membrane protein YkoI